MDDRHPVTTTLPVLLEDGSDAAFRRFLHGFLTVADRMETLRERFGRRIGITGPQYSLLMAVMQLSGAGVALCEVADYLRVSRAFVTLESGRLVRGGVLVKRANPDDGRSSLLSLSATGRRLLRASRRDEAGTRLGPPRAYTQLWKPRPAPGNSCASSDSGRISML